MIMALFNKKELLIKTENRNLESYNLTGNKLSQGNYDKGIKTGKWFFWTEKALKEVDYVDSKIINVNEWNHKSELATNF